MPPAEDAENSSSRKRVKQAIGSISEAQRILDELGDCPELAARLQQVLDALEERQNQSA